jgi:uncharacterized protein YqeY
MTLFEMITNDYLHSRRSKDELQRNLLSTLIGDLTKNQKIEDGEKVSPTDLEIIPIVKKFKDNALFSISKLHEGDLRIKSLNLEIIILDQYLPKQLSEDEIKEEIYNALSKGNHDIGTIMKFINLSHEGKFDRGLTSKLIKVILIERKDKCG